MRWLIVAGVWLSLTTLLMVVGFASSMLGYEQLAAITGVLFIASMGLAMALALIVLSVLLVQAGLQD